MKIMEATSPASAPLTVNEQRSAKLPARCLTVVALAALVILCGCKSLVTGEKPMPGWIERHNERAAEANDPALKAARENAK